MSTWARVDKTSLLLTLQINERGAVDRTLKPQGKRMIASDSKISVILAIVLCICICVPSGPTHVTGAEQVAADVKWLKGIDEALKQAQLTDQDVLVNFTGHGWCHFCTLLEREVFSKPEFAEAAKDFVLVELDFPSAEAAPIAGGKGGPTPLDRLRELQTKYLALGFPTVVVMDSRGVPIAYTGYDKGTTPASFLKDLQTYRTARINRDLAIQEAEGKSSTARAVCLNAALECVAPHLGTLKEHNGDALLSWYGDTVTEICRLDAQDKLGLRTKNEHRQRDLRLFIESERIFSKLDEFKSNKEALAYIELTLPSVSDPGINWRLEWARQVYLEWDRQHSVALENARGLLQRTDLTRDQRDNLNDRIAFNLKNLARFAEAVAQFDELIAANQDRPSRRRAYLSSKAWDLNYAADKGGDRRAAIIAFQQLLESCEPRSDDWETATWGLAMQFQKSGKFCEALALRRELLDFDASPESLLDLTETFISLKKLMEAAETLSKAEKLIASLGEKRQADKVRLERLNIRTQKLKQELSPAKK